MGRRKKQQRSDSEGVIDMAPSEVVEIRSTAPGMVNLSSRDEKRAVNLSIAPGVNRVACDLWSIVKESPIVSKLVNSGYFTVSQ